MKVLFVVTHLLGSGHLSRALVLARAHLHAGHEVTLVSGGMPAPHLSHEGISFVQLPAIRSDGVNFSRLLDETGQEVSHGVMDERRRILITTLKEAAPDVLVTELFPFGRRSLTDEFLALLDAAKARRICICCSIRDILAPPSKPAKAARVRALVDTYYDAVLVHSDPDITPLEASWPVTPDILAKLRYTGFVAPAPAPEHAAASGKGQILVTTGGGAVGDALYATACQAATLDSTLNWHVLIGGGAAQPTVAALRKNAPANVIIEPARPDFRQMLHHARASVSMCGYNTALDILQAGTPAVFVPFDAGGEVEQSLRAAALSKMDGIEVIKSAALDATTLLQAVYSVLAAPDRPAQTQGLDGAENTVRVLETLCRACAHAD